LIELLYLNVSFKRVVDETSKRHAWPKKIKRLCTNLFAKGLVGGSFWKVDDFL